MCEQTIMIKKVTNFHKTALFSYDKKGSECLQLLRFSPRVDNQTQKMVFLVLSNNSTHLNYSSSYYMGETQNS